ncbi:MULTISPECIES: LysR family transcriptional regulator [Paraburkholderia]|uniref:LysR family transcriptional regulator n=1 Tax=Paraburkholderia TaxID=1822464 RepID=UPI00037C1971|nr:MULTISPECIES: LysR family transcriptional regulator [Paraburkholderia]MDH6146426.1 DNA-binding transcriptional LysR family regulator [Paraburkholderia sp. WSM4179]MDH6147082.1 DNA-binding transcriptional LysR family regulator [Paraburkholderia sp. WSM4179]
MKLDPVSLSFFIAVVEEGSIAAAAEREHIAAPAVSKRISALEETLRTTLLTRHHKGVEPTAAGYVLLNLARRAVNYLDDIHSEMLDFASGTRGQVRVFSNISAITQFLPDDLATFLTDHPAVEIRLEERNSLVTLRSVAENAADVGIFTVEPHAESVETLPYEEDELAVVVRRDHPLAGRRHTRFEETLSWDFVGLRTGSAINTQLTQIANRLQKEFRLRIQVTGYDALCLMVSSGLGIAVAPRNLTKLFVKRLGITEVPLEEPWAHRRLGIAIRNREALSPAAESLVVHLQARAAARREG